MKLLSVVLLLTVCVNVSQETTEGHNEDHEKGHEVGGVEGQTERDEKGQTEDTRKGHTVVNKEENTVGHKLRHTKDTKMGQTLVNEEVNTVEHEKRQIEDNTKGQTTVNEEEHAVGHEKGQTEDTKMGHTLVNEEGHTVGHQKTDTVVNEEGNEEKHEMRHTEDTKKGHTLVNQEGHRVGHDKKQAELQEVEVESRHEVGARARHMKVVYGWSEVDYVYPDEKTRDNAIVDESYIPGNSLPISVDVDPTSGKVFIILPRIRPGVPASLAVVSEKKGFGEENMLVPYPSWAWHKQGDCEGITSVFRVFVDECRRLWVLDTGNVQDGDHDRRICPPQILIFDLNNDQIIKRYEFPDEVVFAYSLLVTIVVDVRDKGRKCRDSFAYIADVDGFGLVVYNHARDESWRVTANGMYPYPPFGLFDIHGTQFDLMDGILGLALTPKQDNVDRVLYFHALASNVEYWVETSLLRNKTNFPHGLNKVPRRFFMSPGKRTGQAAAESFDENRVLFFSSLPEMTINCWNSRRPYTANNLVAVDKDEEAFQFISGMKVVKNRQGVSELWALSSRFQRYMEGGFDGNDINYRVMKAPIDALVKGTSCAVPKKVLVKPGLARPPSPGGARPLRPSPGGARPVRPSPGGARPLQPSPGGARPVRPSPGGARPLQPSPGGARPVRPSSALQASSREHGSIWSD